MDPFSYLSVLLSIILGLGIAQLLTAAGRLIRARDVVRTYWPPLVWATIVLVMHVQTWWAMFGLRSRQSWSFLEFLVVLLQTGMLYMGAALVLPETADAPGVDLRVHYERHAPWFFGFLVAGVLASLLKELVLEGGLPAPANLAFHLFVLATGGAAVAVRRARYHQWLAVVAAVSIALYIGVLFSELR